MTRYIDIVFDGPPSHESGRFVEVEDEEGRSIKVGEWIDRGGGDWALRLQVGSISLNRDHTEVTYSISGVPTWRSGNLTIPQGATITSVYLQSEGREVPVTIEPDEAEIERLLVQRHRQWVADLDKRVAGLADRVDSLEGATASIGVIGERLDSVIRQVNEMDGDLEHEPDEEHPAHPEGCYYCDPTVTMPGLAEASDWARAMIERAMAVVHRSHPKKPEDVPDETPEAGAPAGGRAGTAPPDTTKYHRGT